MKIIFMVFVLTVVFIMGMTAIEKKRTQDLNEINISYQSALQQIGLSSNTSKVSVETEESIEEDGTIEVGIYGEVVNSGTYSVKEGEALITIINAAGGVTNKADIEAFKEYHIVEDGIRYYIPPSNNGNKISINTADAIALDMLPGIGPTLANRIISYREENGEFTAIEQLKNVDGVGDTVFEKVKDLVRL